MKEVAFNPDERALLDVLQAKAAGDGCVRTTDSELIRALGIEEGDIHQRFFAPKMRLVAAGAISLHVNRNGGTLIQLNMIERKGVRQSERYVLAVVPLGLFGSVLHLVRKHRTGIRLANRAIKKAEHRRETHPEIVEHPDLDTRDERVMEKLGVHEVERGPVRAPLAKEAGGHS